MPRNRGCSPGRLSIRACSYPRHTILAFRRAGPGRRSSGDTMAKVEIFLLVAGVGLSILAATVVFASIRRTLSPFRRPASDGRSDYENLPPFKRPDVATVPPDKFILRSLQSLLERDPPDAFVILEHAATRRFVQFRRSDAGVMLDFPLRELTDDEQQRARALFAASALPNPTSAGEDGTSNTCEYDFGADLERAAGVADEIFRKVFGLEGSYPLFVKTES